MRALAVIAIGVGIAFLAGSLVWALLFPASRSWTTEKNDRMSELSVKAHKLGGALDDAKRHPSMHGRRAADIETEYQQATDELTQLRLEFEGKRDRPKTIAKYLRFAGIAFVVAGAIVVFANKSD